jgi:NAD(P)H dehydrogenase (quinone)
MTITVIGATGRVGSAVVQRLLDAHTAVRILVRDPDKANRLFGDNPRLESVRIHLDDPSAVSTGLSGSDAVFVAMGSIGAEANLQRIVIQAAAATPGLRQLVRLSVLNAGPNSLGINQRGHWSLDFAAQVAGVPYTTIRPAIFSASMLAGASEIKTSRTWTGLAGTGRVALIDHRDAADAAARVLTEPAAWGQHYDLTGPRQVSWPEALQALSAVLGETVTFRTSSATNLIQKLTQAGVAPGQAELLVTREWAIIAGENERTTGKVRELTGHEPRTIEEFFRENRALFRSG